jgi:hypothetical protein
MPTGADLLEQVAALKHDLGKYVAWTSANLDDALWDGPVEMFSAGASAPEMSGDAPGDPLTQLIAALRADLLETHKHGDRTQAAWDVWRGYAATLPSPLEPELEAVAAAVAVLERVGPALVDGDRQVIARERASIRAAQQTIRAQLRDLHRRLLRGPSPARGR